MEKHAHQKLIPRTALPLPRCTLRAATAFPDATSKYALVDADQTVLRLILNKVGTGRESLETGRGDHLERRNVEAAFLGVPDQYALDCHLLSTMARGIKDTYTQKLVRMAAQQSVSSRL
jgi:hypothetical protein